MTSDVAGAKELVECGKMGFVVAQRLPEELAIKILALLADDGLWLKIGSASRK